MANERKTEQLIRNRLKDFWYYENNDIIIEEQRSDSSIVSSLLSKASKKGSGAWYPEFIIRAKNSDLVILVECKANIKDHESEKRDNPSKYAVDWVLHYCSFLKDKFNLIWIALSWEKEENSKLSIFQWNKWETRYFSKNHSTISSYKNYFDIFHGGDEINIQETELLSYSKKLHDEMRDEAKLKEAEKPLLIAALLLAIDNEDFVREYVTITNPIKLAKRIIEAIKENLSKAWIDETKIKSLISEFSFIETHTYLTKGSIDQSNPSHKNNSLHKFLVDVQRIVYPFMKKMNKIDILWNFYSEFLRYTWWDWKWLWIVLTPHHIADLFCEIAQVNKHSRVLDICTGTWWFLISAMNHMLKDDPTVPEITNIYKKNLVWIETQSNMFALACANMIIRWDWKTNLMKDNCFDVETSELKKYDCDIWIINPPYAQKKEDEHELKFVEKMLDSLQSWWIWIAIIPLNKLVKDDVKTAALKENILKKHTLIWWFSMPDDLFYPVWVVTWVIVFRSWKPHNKNIKSRFWYRKNDWLEKVKNKWRVDVQNKREKIKNKWVSQFLNWEEIKYQSIKVNIDEKKEWCVEPYLDTDYTKISQHLFEKNIRTYLANKITKGKIKDISHSSINNDLINLNADKRKEFKYWDKDVFDLEKWYYNKKPYIDEKWTLAFVWASDSNNWITSYHNPDDVEKIFPWNCVTIANDGSVWEAFYQEEEFTCSHSVNILRTKKKKMNIYIAMFLVTVIKLEKFRWSYWRKRRIERMKESIIKLPTNKNGEPDWEFMENYIKSLPYSSSL